MPVECSCNMMIPVEKAKNFLTPEQVCFSVLAYHQPSISGGVMCGLGLRDY
jgi:hypothetical protein